MSDWRKDIELAKEYYGKPLDYWHGDDRKDANLSRYIHGQNKGLAGLVPAIGYTGLKALAQSGNPVIAGIGKRLVASMGPTSEEILNSINRGGDYSRLIQLAPKLLGDIPHALMTGKSYDNSYTVNEESLPASFEDIAAYIRGMNDPLWDKTKKY